MNQLLEQRLTDAAHAILGTLFRRLLTILGTALVTRGLVDQGTVDGIVPMAAELIVGTLFAAGATGWGMLRAYIAHTRLAAAVVALKAQAAAQPG